MVLSKYLLMIIILLADTYIYMQVFHCLQTQHCVVPLYFCHFSTNPSWYMFSVPEFIARVVI